MGAVDRRYESTLPSLDFDNCPRKKEPPRGTFMLCGEPLDQPDRIPHTNRPGADDIRVDSRLTLVALRDRLQHAWILVPAFRIEIHNHAAGVPLSYADKRFIADLQQGAGPGLLLERTAGGRLHIHIRAKLPAVDRAARFGGQFADAHQAADRNVLTIKHAPVALEKENGVSHG